MPFPANPLLFIALTALLLEPISDVVVLFVTDENLPGGVAGTRALVVARLRGALLEPPPLPLLLINLLYAAESNSSIS